MASQHIETAASVAHISDPSRLWQRLDGWLERAGERLNPILVKEARQALKSRQFLITFTLLLISGWAWSLIGVAMQSPDVHYGACGPFMLLGYYFVLNVPLLLIVPFVAYRSLASEREDGTYELLSITALSSRQIVTGKLGSAVLQMLVYYSALSPCIAFTYLLRGVDILTIVFLLGYTFLGSLLLSAFGLVVASATRYRHVQVLLSVLLLLGLAILTFAWCGVIADGLDHGIFYFDDEDFWLGHAVFLTFYVSYLVLCVIAAAAQLSFASDNRSTKLRVVMLVQQVLLTGWVMHLWLKWPDDEALLVLGAISGVHWMVMGALMTGERAELSPRVKRRLPQSMLGRMLCTWFNPGAGTGYVFAVVNLAAALLVACGAGLVAQMIGFAGAPRRVDFYTFSVVLWAYVAAYLGFGRLLILVLNRYVRFGLLLPFLLHGLLAVFGLAVPFFLQMWLQGFGPGNDYTVLQAPNWGWTLLQAADGKLWSTPESPILVLLVGLVMFVVNLTLAAGEVEHTRQELPDRVVRDEMELHPERFRQAHRPASPWDE